MYDYIMSNRGTLKLNKFFDIFFRDSYYYFLFTQRAYEAITFFI